MPSDLIAKARALRRKIEQMAIMTIDTDEEAVEFTDLFPAWDGNGIDYFVGDRVRYLGDLYKVLQDHKSFASWTPTNAPSLYAKVLNPDPDVIPVWVQPDSTNGYMTGDKVHFPGISDPVYESLIDNNVWSPEGYPAGWRLVDEPEIDPEPEPEPEPEIEVEDETGDIPVWTQPDSTTAYSIGDKVRYPGSSDPVYESLLNGNVWSPESYPAGWRLVEE